MTLLKIQAIQTALTGNWEKAITLNQELLKDDPEDIETLNRLGFAFTVLGKMKDAKHAYQKVLQIDKYNPIALKNLKRLTEIPQKSSNNTSEKHIINTNNSMFLEEIGKTKVVELINIAEPKFIANLMIAESLELKIKRLKIFVLDLKKHYIGMLPDDIGKRLIKLINGGNKYETCVKSADSHRVCVFIKEIKRATKFKNQPSFTTGENSKSNFSRKVHASSKHKNEIDETEDIEEEN